MIGDSELGGTMLLLGASAVLSGIIDNIPYVATMAPITSDLVQAMGGDTNHVMWWALAIGADLGGNATAVGASANVVVLGIAERNRNCVSNHVLPSPLSRRAAPAVVGAAARLEGVA
ncbi:SLC13 family permease [Streptomyces sp. NBC_01727]|uniref:SLC13 family permease n=1 Tax=Streptomyces sp. NBC_01727 TaxID=2975924 RepID=UPI002E107A5B|nr:SLC13 family permease [Streptomyces sp. NBC_01727]